MEFNGKAQIPDSIKILPVSSEAALPLIGRWLKETKKVKVTVSFDAYISGTMKPGIIMFGGGSEPAEVNIRTWYKRRSLSQLATLKALESILFWAMEGKHALNSKWLWPIHQGIMEEVGERVSNPVCGNKPILVTTSSEYCDTYMMNKFIDCAVDHILEYELPQTLVEPLSKKRLSDIFREWFIARFVQEDIDGISSWDEYKTRFDFCEFTFTRNIEPLDQIHIVSRGSDKKDIDAPWNWIHGRHSIHMRTHAYGWDAILKEFPHIIPKVKRARDLAGKLDR
jgi:hypothetical protein